MARQSNTAHDENRREKNLRDEMFIMNISQENKIIIGWKNQ